MVRADERLKREFPQITLPVLILHGTADQATRPSGSQRFYDHAGSTDKTLKLYEGHFHDLLNDLGKDEVMTDILQWIDARLPRGGDQDDGRCGIQKLATMMFADSERVQPDLVGVFDLLHQLSEPLHRGSQRGCSRRRRRRNVAERLRPVDVTRFVMHQVGCGPRFEPAACS
jgi:hypothetical protein